LPKVQSRKALASPPAFRIPWKPERVTKWIGQNCVREAEFMEQGKIYCVDDDADILALYEAILQAAGHEAVPFYSGTQALAALRGDQPDLIILDEKMSDLSGRELCTRLRADKQQPYIPIIMVTGVGTQEGKLQSLAEGADDYLLKPFDQDELLAKVQVMLRIRRLYAALLQTRQDLLRAEKLAAIGQFAAAIAHEIRNPLSILSASVQQVISQYEKTDERYEVLNKVLRKISGIDATLRELLSVARPLKLKREALDVNGCLREAAGFLEDKCSDQGVALRLDLAPQLPPVLGDDEHLQRAFLNLLLNSIYSMEHGGELRVVSGMNEQHDRVFIRIQDTGTGIEASDLPHLFEPFYSRRPGGTGLGLYVVKMILDELQGEIQVTSQMQQGTNMTIHLPAAKKEPVPQA
jgi:signal transduction histidine kinase